MALNDPMCLIVSDIEFLIKISIWCSKFAFEVTIYTSNPVLDFKFAKEPYALHLKLYKMPEEFKMLNSFDHT